MKTIRFKHLLCVLIAFSGSLAFAQQKLVPAQSEISFVSKQMGVPVEGHFKKFDAQIAFDPAKPATAKISFVVDMASASFGIPETDAELLKSDWFHTAKFAQASFQSTAVKALGAGQFEVSGKLSVKGNNHDVVVPVKLTQSGTNTVAAGAFSLKRLNFKIGENEWADTSMVADDVLVKFKFTLTGVAKL